MPLYKEVYRMPLSINQRVWGVYLLPEIQSPLEATFSRVPSRAPPRVPSRVPSCVPSPVVCPVSSVRVPSWPQAKVVGWVKVLPDMHKPIGFWDGTKTLQDSVLVGVVPKVRLRPDRTNQVT